MRLWLFSANRLFTRLLRSVFLKFVSVCVSFWGLYAALFHQIMVAVTKRQQKKNITTEISIHKYNLTRPKHGLDLELWWASASSDIPLFNKINRAYRCCRAEIPQLFSGTIHSYILISTYCWLVEPYFSWITGIYFDVLWMCVFGFCR